MIDSNKSATLNSILNELKPHELQPRLELLVLVGQWHYEDCNCQINGCCPYLAPGPAPIPTCPPC